MPHSPPQTPCGDVEGQQLLQRRAQSPQRQMANALGGGVAQSLANAVGKCQFVVDPGLGLSHMTSFNLNYFFKDPHLQIQLHSEVLGVRTSIYKFEAGHLITVIII